MDTESPFAALAEAEVTPLAAPEAQAPTEAVIEATTDSPQPEGVSDEVNAALEGHNASEIGALIAQVPPEHRGVVEQMRRVMQSRVDKARNEAAQMPGNQLWKGLEEDPDGTMQYLMQHYGYQPAPQGPDMPAQEEVMPDPLEQDVSSIKQYIQQQQMEQQIDNAVRQTRSLARQFEVELSDLEMEAIIKKSAQYGWNTEMVFKSEVADKLVNRQAKPVISNEQPSGEIDDVNARWMTWGAQARAQASHN